MDKRDALAQYQGEMDMRGFAQDSSVRFFGEQYLNFLFDKQKQNVVFLLREEFETDKERISERWLQAWNGERFPGMVILIENRPLVERLKRWWQRLRRKG